MLHSLNFQATPEEKEDLQSWKKDKEPDIHEIKSKIKKKKYEDESAVNITDNTLSVSRKFICFPHVLIYE